jgi:molecular chaperone DnaK (HSP70)
MPLSIQAKEMAQKAAQDPASQEIVALFEKLSITSTDTSSPLPANESDPVTIGSVFVKTVQDDQALRLKAYREPLHKSAVEHKPKSAPNPLFTTEQKERISHLNEEVAQEKKRRRIEEERRRQEEERKRREAEERRRQDEARRRKEACKAQELLNEALRKFGGKTFSSNQEARRFFMNIIAGLPEEVAKKITNRGIGWRCNAYNCVHDSPCDCADPSRGGVWLIR